LPLSGKKILIVDDEPEITSLLVQILTMAHAKVFTAADGSRALWMMETDKFDIIVFDLVMPVTDGIQLATVARKEKLNPNAKYVALSGNFSADTIKELAALNIVNCLTKPVKAQEFVSSLCKIISPPAP
jgi:CheY-like chemotaxis protein